MIPSLPNSGVQATPSLFPRPKAIVRHKMSRRDEGLAFFSHCHRQLPQPSSHLEPKPPDLELVNPDLQPTSLNLVLPRPDLQKLDVCVTLAGDGASPEKSTGAELGRVNDFEEESVPTVDFGLVVKTPCKQYVFDPFWSSVCDDQVVPCLQRMAELVVVLGFSGTALSVGPDVGLERLKGDGLDGMGLRGEGGLDKGELDFVLSLPRRPPDPSVVFVFLNFCCICSFRPESWSLVFTISLCCLSKILYPHEAHLQALRVLNLCPPTDGPVLDRSTVAFYAWGCLPIFGRGKGIEGWSGWVYVDLGPRYSDLFPPLTV